MAETKQLTAQELKTLYANVKAAQKAIADLAQSLQQQMDFASKADPDLSLAGVTPGKPSVDLNRIFALSELLLPKIALDFIDTTLVEDDSGEAVSVQILAGEPIPG